MGKKVFHVSDDVHRLVVQYCQQNGYQMSDWVSRALTKAVTSDAPVPMLEKKVLPKNHGDVSDLGAKPWEQPAFYERKPQEDDSTKSSGPADPRAGKS